MIILKKYQFFFNLTPQNKLNISQIILYRYISTNLIYFISIYEMGHAKNEESGCYHSRSFFKDTHIHAPLWVDHE